LLIYIISSFFVGWATDRIGPRGPLVFSAVCIGIGYIMCSSVQSIGQLYLFYSIASVGAGIVWSLPLSTVQRWFSEKRGLALGIAVSGIGIGTLVWAQLANLLIYRYGWRTAYVVIGVVSGVLLLFAALVIGRKPEKSRAWSPRNASPVPTERIRPPSNPGGVAELGLNEALVTKELWLICLFQFFFNVGIFLVFVHLVPFATQNGIGKAAAAAAMGSMGGFSVLGRILSPVMIEKKLHSSWESGLMVCAICAGLVLLWLPWVKSFGMLFVFVVILGYFYGSWIPLVVALTGSCFGLRHLGTLLGVTQIGLIGGILGPLLGGFVYDRTASYTTAFYICSISFFVSFAIALMIKIIREK
jgi:MFS family permease